MKITTPLNSYMVTPLSTPRKNIPTSPYAACLSSGSPVKSKGRNAVFGQLLSAHSVAHLLFPVESVSALEPVIPTEAQQSMPCIVSCSFTGVLLGQHYQISWNRCHVGSTRIQGWVRWDWWGDCDQIQSGTVRGQLVEIGTSHQLWWNILREHNWDVPSAHINFIYYVTYILEYSIVLWGRMCTGTYTIL